MRQAGGHQPRSARLQRGVLHGAQVHAGVFLGSMRVRGQDGQRVDALDSDLHSSL